MLRLTSTQFTSLNQNLCSWRHLAYDEQVAPISWRYDWWKSQPKQSSSDMSKQNDVTVRLTVVKYSALLVNYNPLMSQQCICFKLSTNACHHHEKCPDEAVTSVLEERNHNCYTIVQQRTVSKNIHPSFHTRYILCSVADQLCKGIAPKHNHASRPTKPVTPTSA